MTGRTTRRGWTLVLVVTIAMGFSRAAAEEAGSVLEEILTIMRESGQITEAKKKALLERAKREGEQAKAEREAAEKAQKAQKAGITAGIEDARPFLRSEDGAFRLFLGGRLQVDYDAAEDKARTLSGATLNDQFLARRARIELSGTFFQWIDLRLEAELTAGVSLNDGYLDFRFMPELGLRAGQFKVPFSLEELTSDNTIDFVERSIVNELAPSRDLGAALRGSLFGGIVGYDLGVFNGSGLNAVDTNSGKDVAGRVTVAPFKATGNAWLKGLQLAGDFTGGDQNLGRSARGRTSARTANRFEFFAAQPTRGDRTRWGTDLLWLVGPAALKFEYDHQANERVRLGSKGADLDDIETTGWYVSATYVLTGEEKSLNGPVVPRRPLNPVAGQYGPGAWELALRYAQLTFRSDDPVNFFDGNISSLKKIPGGRATAENGVDALTVGVNWYLTSRVRYMVNWTDYWYDNPLGTPFSCEQVSCDVTKLRPRNDPSSWEILSRLQLWF